MKSEYLRDSYERYEEPKAEAATAAAIEDDEEVLPVVEECLMLCADEEDADDDACNGGALSGTCRLRSKYSTILAICADRVLGG